MTGCVNWYLAGMEHKGKYHKTNWLDKVLNFYWYFGLIRKYVFNWPGPTGAEELASTEAGGMEMQQRGGRRKDGDVEDADEGGGGSSLPDDDFSDSDDDDDFADDNNNNNFAHQV